MATLRDIPTPQYPPQEDLETLYKQVLAGYASEATSPYTEDPTGDISVDTSLGLSDQPATPSSVNTTSQSYIPSPPPPPPLPLPVPRTDSSGPTGFNGRPSRPLPRPLPQPPTSSGPRTPLSNPSPSTSTAASIDPYPITVAQPTSNKQQHGARGQPSTSLNGTAASSTPGLQDSPTDPEYDEQEDPDDNHSESEVSDIDESGAKILPVPPYFAQVDPKLTLLVGPPAEGSTQLGTFDGSTDFSSSSQPYHAADSFIQGSSQTYDSGPVHTSSHPLDPGPSARPILGDILQDRRWREEEDRRWRGQELLHDDSESRDAPPESNNREYVDFSSEDYQAPRSANLERRYSRFLTLIGPAASDFGGSGVNREPRRVQQDYDIMSEFDDGDASIDDDIFVNYSLLSHLATLLRDKVPRGTHVKGSIPYPRAFTGKDIVSTIHSQISRELRDNHGGNSSDRRPALLVARSLQSQLFFYEVEWGGRVLQDGVGDVYMFLDDPEEPSDTLLERAEIPTGVVSILTRCYSPSCGEFDDCYSSSCPRKGMSQLPATTETLVGPQQDPWPATVSGDLLNTLTDSEINRQTIIHKLLSKEEQYVNDLDVVESVFIRPLRNANPPIYRSGELEEVIDEIFGNTVQVRDVNRRLLEVLYVRQREQAPVVAGIGDIFLDAATTDFRDVYPTYIGHHPNAERKLREELDRNPAFRLLIENCSRRQSTRPGQSPRLDLKHFLNRPVEHLQKYRVLLEAIYKETDRSNPDGDFLTEAIKALDKLQTLAQVHTFQETTRRGSFRKWEWSDLVTPSERQFFTREEARRQSIIFELIETEMSYVKDLENIDKIFVTPLRDADPPIIPRDRLFQFLHDVFSNIQDVCMYHRRLVDQLHHIQREHHPKIPSITAAVFDAALNFRDAYLQYIPNYPIAAYRIEEEREKNPAFKDFHDHCIRHPSAGRLDMMHFIYRPIPRLLRYELLLKGIVDETPQNHEDRSAIPSVIEIIKSLGKDTEPGVTSAKQKVDLWRYNSSINFKPGEHMDLDLLNDSRSLIHTGKLYRQPDGGLGQNNWVELFAILFDNYLVMTKPKQKDGVTKYYVTRRPIPLDLLSLVKFDDPPTHRTTGMLRNRFNDRNPESPTGPGHSRSDSAENRLLYPWSIHHAARLGGQCVLYAESSSVRLEWQKKLEETLGLRKAIMESNKVFEMETLSQDTFFLPPATIAPMGPAWNDVTMFTGKVTCSVPFATNDGRKLVAIGCAEGVWIGFLHDSRSMRRVLHLQMVTQCAILEDFGLFLVLADKALFAYHIEALVPTQPNIMHVSQPPQKLNSNREAHFFSVGTLHGRTLVIYMKKRGTDSFFYALEPITDKIVEPPKTSSGFGSVFGFRPKTGSEWFRPYKDFRLPSEAYDLIFLKAKVAILCAKGFEIMDLDSLSSVTIPQPSDARFAQRCESCRPLGMFRVTDDEFILCYNEFGLYVNKHGDSSRKNDTVEWEGTADRVALHAPYVLLFDPRFIEIRHVETGRLAQIIMGTDVRCIWDGRGPDSSPAIIPAEGPDENMSQDPRVHVVMNATEPPAQYSGRTNRAITQHVSELIPTIPLYLPDPIASPPAAPHFQPSFSPPRSPPLRPAASHRS